MKNWKTRLFGDSSLNFYGWMLAALIIVLGSLYLVKKGLDAEEYLRPYAAFLLAIYTVLVGCFGILLQNYLARVAEKLEAAGKDQNR